MILDLNVESLLIFTQFEEIEIELHLTHDELLEFSLMHQKIIKKVLQIFVDIIQTEHGDWMVGVIQLKQKTLSMLLCEIQSVLLDITDVGDDEIKKTENYGLNKK